MCLQFTLSLPLPFPLALVFRYSLSHCQGLPCPCPSLWHWHPGTLCSTAMGCPCPGLFLWRCHFGSRRPGASFCGPPFPCRRPCHPWRQPPVRVARPLARLWPRPPPVRPPASQPVGAAGAAATPGAWGQVTQLPGSGPMSKAGEREREKKMTHTRGNAHLTEAVIPANIQGAPVEQEDRFHF